MREPYYFRFFNPQKSPCNMLTSDVYKCQPQKKYFGKPKLIWEGGTYVKSIHGKIGTRKTRK